jgi:hypothetical protein
VLDDGNPSRGAGKVVGDGVRRLSKATSEGKEEKDDWVSVGVTPTSWGRWIVGSMASAPGSCGNSALKKESEGMM